MPYIVDETNDDALFCNIPIQLLNNLDFGFVDLGIHFYHEMISAHMTKVRSTKGQMKMLVELVSNDPQLAASKFTANFTQKMFKERWNKIATELNARLGAEKSGEKWKKAWQDARAATKTKAAALRRHINGTGGRPASHIIMSDFQNDVLPLLSQASVTGHCLSSESEVTFSFEDVVAKGNSVIICNETEKFGFADGNEQFKFDDVENDVRPVDIIEQQLDVEHYQHIITVEVEQEKDKHQKLDFVISEKIIYIDMPPIRRSNLGRRTRNATNQANYRSNSQTREARASLNRAAFSYDVSIDYSNYQCVVIGSMNSVCSHCKALKYKNEANGLCCANGKVKLIPLDPPPEPLYSLVSGIGTDSIHFLTNIQQYNNCFQMTSFGATNVVRENFMPTFKIQGQIYHRAGSLLPVSDSDNKFLQIYFMGNSPQEIDLRCAHNNLVKRSIVEQLQTLFHQHNQLIILFKTALDLMPSDNHKIVIRADKTPAGQHTRRFNAPTIDEVAIVVVGENLESRDIVLRRRNDQLQRIKETHRSYDALQYPIIFWQGEDGYDFSIKMINPIAGSETNKKVSSMNYYSYRLMIRENEDNHILKCRRLYHKYVVDMYVKIETERLTFIRLNQTKLRSEEYIHLRDAINTDGNAQNVGRMTILPATYIGSPRHMHEYAQDAMSYVRHYGTADLFITFTCNPQWIEINQELFSGQSPIDRHDITARVFRQKLKSLMDFIVKHNVFGETRCWMYSVEWQKRGLPHAHILIWLVENIRPNEVDAVISAEIPNVQVDPGLHEVVIKNMIHGPCGTLNQNSPCMMDGKCSKRYPRTLISETITGNDGYPLYRRRSTADNGKSTIVKLNQQDIEIDNRWIVPYSPILSKTFKAHINVESCHSVKSIKYICKYVAKGSDMAVIGIGAENSNDEVTQYQMGRYVSSNEAVWRIFSFPIHERHPSVVHLAVHLENGQRVYFTAQNAVQRAAQPPSTTLTSFFETCQNDDFAQTLLYSEMPKYYTWNQSSRRFIRRKQGKPVPGYTDVYSTDAIGRIYSVHPSNDECFYLRLLLVNVRGPTSFQQLRTVDGELCVSYREACQRLQLLENDAHWDQTLNDAVISSHAHQIRTLFSIIISTCFPSSPIDLWIKYKDYMCDDILYQIQNRMGNPNIQISEEIYNEALISIEDMCLIMSNKLLIQLGLTAPNRPMHDAFNQELHRERLYDLNDLKELIQTNLPLLNEQQKYVFETLMKVTNDETGGIYFLDAPGGTGKTFLISLILATIRSQNKIALALASSGIAATLLEGGRTAHSALKLPLNMHSNETPTCNVSKNSAMAKVLQQCKLIVWDECTMAHKKSLEALDRTLKDLRSNNNRFGGAMILLAGDFRQTLPVIPRSTPADELNACLKSSSLWKHVKVLHLSKICVSSCKMTNLETYSLNNSLTLVMANFL
ncbi:uncharacterized protein LOC126550758 [Aphis gossypii]|uniref:uncharacterized protein LOC126550758 n=2 Tax=Aphis gossypii TaxID=80765 RepID=UPI0021592701|nr:uncharacterized protein LOC126550758 [Aphis gossypii]